MTDFLRSLQVSGSGLAAQAERLSIVSQNIANADTPGYQRKQVTFAEEFTTSGQPARMVIDRVTLDRAEGRRILDPSHPLAGDDGFYEGSNVNLMVEMADSQEAQRSYEANLRSFANALQMSRSLLDLLKR